MGSMFAYKDERFMVQRWHGVEIRRATEDILFTNVIVCSTKADLDDLLAEYSTPVLLPELRVHEAVNGEGELFIYRLGETPVTHKMKGGS